MLRRLLDLATHVAVPLVLCGPMATQAALITIENGQTVVFNVDMTGENPAPPYNSLLFRLGVDFSNSGNNGGTHTVFYGGLDAIRPLIVDPFVNFGSLFGLPLDDPDFLDGVFSIVMTVQDGPLVFDPSVQGQVVLPRGVAVIDLALIPSSITDAPPGTVPEPASLLLALLAGPAIAARRRLRLA